MDNHLVYVIEAEKPTIKRWVVNIMAKKTLAFLLSCVLLSMVIMPALASPIITPFYTNTVSLSGTLSFSGAKATCTSTVIGRSGTSGITLTLNLERKNANGTYTLVKSWSTTTTEEYAIMSKDYYVSTGYTYRLTSIANVTRNGTTETVTGSTEEYCY